MRWSDLDIQQHVNNAVYVDYMQEARVEWITSTANADLLGRGLIVVNNQVEYLRPLEYRAGASVEVRLWVGSVGGTKLDVNYEIYAEDHLSAKASTTLAYFDLADNRLRRFTPEQRAAFAADIIPGDHLQPLPRPEWTGNGSLLEMRARWSDMDCYGHVNNYRYYDYAQQARTSMIDPTSIPEYHEHPYPLWLLVRQDCDYIKQVRFRSQPYVMHSAVTNIGNTSTTIVHELRDADSEVYARLFAVLVHADGHTGRPARLPDYLRRHLERWVPDSAQN